MIKKIFLLVFLIIFFHPFTHPLINSLTHLPIYSSTVYAFEPGFPKLVWEKEFPFEITDIEMADESGDVLLCHKDSAQLILIDPQGYERLHFGPNLETLIMEGISISADGSKIMYAESLPRFKGELHYITRNGKEIWKKDIKDIQYLSPKGDWYVLAYQDNWDEEKPVIKAYDISGKLLWEKNDTYGVLFSLDNNYFLAGANTSGWWSSVEKKDMIIHTYNRKGELKWEGKFKSDEFGYIGEAEITKGGYIVWNYKDYRKIYDYLGNIVTELPQGVQKAFISPDGKTVLYQYESIFQSLNLSDKSIKIEGKMNFIEAKLSNEGRYLVGVKSSTNDIPENIVFYDTQNKSMWKIKIGKNIEEYFGRSLQNYGIFTYLTNNGKYLLILKQGSKHLYYYQLY